MTKARRPEDDRADNTENSPLGANAILGVSLAVAHAAANYQVTAAVPATGACGVHPARPLHEIYSTAASMPRARPTQEFMVPVKAEEHALRIGTEVYHSLKKVLSARG